MESPATRGPVEEPVGARAKDLPAEITVAVMKATVIRAEEEAGRGTEGGDRSGLTVLHLAQAATGADRDAGRLRRGTL